MSLNTIDPRPFGSDGVREYILDMIDQLAAMAAEHGDVDSARALWACWGEVSRQAIKVGAGGASAERWLGPARAAKL